MEYRPDRISSLQLAGSFAALDHAMRGRSEGRSTRVAARLLVVLECLVACACTGSVDDPQRPSSPASIGRRSGDASPTGVVTGGSGPADAQGGSCEARLPARLILLSDYQYLNTLKALLGPGAVSATDAAEHTQQTKPFTQKGVVVSASLVHGRLAWAEHASASLATRFAELTGCNASQADDACAAHFLAAFAGGAFRRPVADEEIADLMAVYDVGKRVTEQSNDFWMACAAYFGIANFTLGDADQHTTAITGLFG